MAKVWVPPYQKKDGTNVAGHYRGGKAKKAELARDQYGNTVEIFGKVGSMVRTSKGLYHFTKLFQKGKQLRRAR